MEPTRLLPKGIDEFLQGFLPFWDGVQCRSAILDLATRIYPTHFDQFETLYLKPLQNALFQGKQGVDGANAISVGFHCFTNMIRNWTRIPWDQIYRNDTSMYITLNL